MHSIFSHSLRVLGVLTLMLSALDAQTANTIAVINSTYNHEWAVAPDSIASL